MSKSLNLKKKAEHLKKYIFKDLWTLELEQISKPRKIITKIIRTLVLAYRGFNEDKVNLRASALTFYSIISVVPIVAMAFGIAKGFGFEQKMQIVLQENLKGQEEVADWIISFAGNMLSNVQGGWMFAFSLLFLFWTIIKVLGNIENSFNSIWQVKQSRVLFRKFSDYLSIMLIGPVVIIASSSAQVLIIEMVDKITNDITFIGYVGPFIYILIKLIPYVLMWLLFTFIYMVMPNTKVKFTSALVAGIIAGTTFQLLQWGYIHFQVGVSKYNAIYGSFAALPLFLIWLNWSWLIVLFGAEISFAVQNQAQYEFESDIHDLSISTKQLISLYLTHFIVKHFEKGDLPLTAQNISRQLKIPVRMVRHLIYDLVECRILAETPSSELKETAFIPAKDIHIMNIQFIMDSINNRGSNFMENQNDIVLDKLQSKLNNFKELILNSSANINIKEI